MAQCSSRLPPPIDAVLEAIRSGEGVPYADYGADLHEGQARLHPPAVREPARQRVAARCARHPRRASSPIRRRVSPTSPAARPVEHRDRPRLPEGARSTESTSDTASIAFARAQPRRAAAVEDRVTFQSRDAADPGLAGRYDLVTIFEALHDMSRPGGGAPHAARRCSPKAVGARRRRARRGAFTAPQASRAPQLRLRASSTASRSAWSARRRGNRHRHARGHRAALCGRGWLRRLRGARDRERLLPLLPTAAVGSLPE